jgi:ACS family tartrate transporter-like MFS transporter
LATYVRDSLPTSADRASALERATLRDVSRRLIPFLFVLYIVSFLDRVNVGFAALEMNRDLRLSPAVYGFGAGIFFIGYSLFEVPSNLILARTGARLWIARIMITWGLIAAGMMFVRGPLSFYLLRFLLGIAEAGFFPGIIFYLSEWFPADARARAVARFMTAIPMSGMIGGPISGALLGLDGRFGLAGWQWLFLLEGLPAVVLGLCRLTLLARPAGRGDMAGARTRHLAGDAAGYGTGAMRRAPWLQHRSSTLERGRVADGSAWVPEHFVRPVCA